MNVYEVNFPRSGWVMPGMWLELPAGVVGFIVKGLVFPHNGTDAWWAVGEHFAIRCERR